MNYVAEIQENSRDLQLVIWDADTPLRVGFPTTHLIEKTPAGFRIRSTGTQGLLTRGFVEVKGTQGQGLGIKVQIREVKPLSPGFSPNRYRREQDPITIFQCYGDWVQSVDSLDNRYRNSYFELRKLGNGYELQTLKKVQVKIAGKVTERKRFNPKDIDQLIVRSAAGITWRVTRLPSSQAIPASDKPSIEPEFLTGLKYAGSTLGAFLLLALLWPTTNPKEELIPAQYAKVILNKSKPMTTSANIDGGDQKVQRAENTQVVRAFRAKALQNSVKGLLKGGLTQLLAHSDLVSANRAHSRALFAARNQDLSKPSDVKAQKTRDTKIAKIGGKSGHGYSKESKTGVQGQGSSFVSLDYGASEVETGLTKDEVGKIIHAHLNEVRYCYESALAGKPTLEGKLVVDFVIAGSGLVQKAGVRTSTLAEPRVNDCILRRLRRWAFPRPKGGIQVAVSYPFIFKSLGR